VERAMARRISFNSGFDVLVMVSVMRLNGAFTISVA
jgi:hypothetical protein